MISRTDIFDKVATAVGTLSLNVYCASVFEPIPPQLPCAFIYEYDSKPTENAITLTYDDEQTEVTYNAEVYVKKASGISTANTIADKIEEAFKSAYFIKTMRQQLDNADPSLYRIMLRFRRKIGGADTI